MPTPTSYPTKDAARQAVWDALQEQRAARFPYPPHGRIPNFAGADSAASRLLDHPPFAEARAIKANPDAPQRPLRLGALERGITVYMPTPRLRGGFYRLDPARIPAEHRKEAASLSRGTRWAEAVPLRALAEPIDLIVTGSVAVTRGGKRCGKGHGYGDLEYAILRGLGHPPIPVVTTAHPLQVVSEFPADPFDLPVSLIATPEEAIEVAEPPPPPDGIDWQALPESALTEMPVLKELKG
ncbi:5-formyltetrahydrofolate cyclo-ligase [Thiohalorhabdus denitrificans]|uniref:5-formyltetrahydrofolate cyclo-ligase n=1 Tax=Thiohalorhabdus denitrificans TaxID=381306 RepID=A0A0P9C814_9GAMM|nr:5-formyltetrahydrofolate cyclo-ligase [Thiohalorhabdus denitrificans]KPV41351.1 5-formyltetrahydrofolate cyclo-ligase [Thiohalorhabdus denitrificans]SCY24085.1 5-formyltetrahydrofolate cyclo-ligase [Thiohalorhabdus denitrificans]